MNIEEIYEILTKELQVSTIYKNEQMSKHTTFKIGGNADIYVKAKTIEDIKSVLKVANEKEIPITVIGNGSNILVKDNGIRGIVIRNRFTRCRYKRRNSNSRGRSKTRCTRFNYTKK